MSLPIAALYPSFCRKRGMSRLVFLAVDSAGTVLPLPLPSVPHQPVSSAAPGPWIPIGFPYPVHWRMTHPGMPTTVPASAELSCSVSRQAFPCQALRDALVCVIRLYHIKGIWERPELSGDLISFLPIIQCVVLMYLSLISLV